MGDITNVSELSIDPGFKFDPANKKMSVKDKIGIYQVAGLHTVTGQMASTDCLQIAGQADIGSPIIVGIGVRDVENQDHPGINIHGILAVTNPTDTVPAVKIQGYRQSGTTVASLADAETILQVVDNSNDGIKFYGNGDLATEKWTDYSDLSTILGWGSYETKEIFYKRIGKTVFCTYYIRGESNTDIASFSLPWVAKSSYYILGWSQNVDSSTLYIGSISIANDVVNVFKQFTANTWASSGTKDIRGNFFFELQPIV